jgi:DNA-binding response OmpR family regulator
MAKVMVADDDVVIVKLVRRLLDDMGHAVTTADNGHDALKLGMEGDFDLYILDVRMPRLDGYSLCRSITRKFPDRKVLLITGLDVSKYESMANASGAAGTIAKPFETEGFKTWVRPFLPR